MISLDEVIGQEAGLAQLEAILESRRLPPGILISGPPKTGKLTAAKAFCARVNCQGTLRSDCTCKSCVKFQAGTYPDVIYLTGNEKGEVSVESIRDTSRRLHLRNYEAGWRLVLVPRIDWLSESCTNALLKQLEEPPQGTTFVCTAVNEVPETIESRCHVVRFGYLPSQTIEYLCARDNSRFDHLQQTLMAGSYDRHLNADVQYLRVLWDASAWDTLPDKMDRRILVADFRCLAAVLAHMVKNRQDRIGTVEIPRLTPTQAQQLLAFISQALEFLDRQVKPFLVLRWFAGRSLEVMS